MQCLTVLKPDGTVAAGQAPPMTGDETIEALRLMILSRTVDSRMTSLQRQGRMGTFSAVAGQEATVVGAAMAIERSDWLVPTYRELPAMIRHGYPLTNFMLYWRGNSKGGSIPEDVTMLPIQIALAAQLPQAVGLAWGLARRHSDRVVLTFFGDGASSEGDAHEALNLAGVVNAPVVFVLQNNGWAISTPRTRQSAAEHLADRARGYGLPGELVDGNDLFAVYTAVRRAVDRARAGHGATLLECVTTRMGAHNTADDPTKYQTAPQQEELARQDPMNRVVSYLEASGERAAETIQRLRDASDAAATEAINAMEAFPEQSPDDLFENVYAALPERLRRQHAWFAHWGRA